MIPRVPLRQALVDPNLLGNMLVGDTWCAWRTLLVAAMGEPLDADERELFKSITGGREHEPGQRVSELVAVVGRRGGKSRAMAVLMAYSAGLCDHSDVLVKGERGIALCVAVDQRVAKIVQDHCAAAFETSPILRQLIANRTQETIELSNGISIEVRPASFRKLRGPSYVAVVADELAFWYQDSSYANPDVEILAAVRPGLLTTRGPLILASSPYAKSGVLWDRYKRHFGPKGSPAILVAHGTSRDFNKTLPQDEIDRALEEDRARNSAEFLAQFRDDVSNYISIEVVEGCIGGHREMMWASGNSYRCFVDPAGGSGEDSFSCAIGHKSFSDNQIIIDATREFRPHFSPAAVIDELVPLIKSYRIQQVTGDHYAGEFPRELFRKHGIMYEVCKQPKSDLFRDLLPLLNSGRIMLPQNDRLVAQISGLERRVTRSGKDSIDHAPNAHDDVANATAGCASILHKPTFSLYSGWLD